ncbi:hypothetical protein C5167_026619 [Papaver somniferum]|nr:hypothetical protein C5167_026619 [Papaver somniferum]
MRKGYKDSFVYLYRHQLPHLAQRGNIQNRNHDEKNEVSRELVILLSLCQGILAADFVVTVDFLNNNPQIDLDIY